MTEQSSILSTNRNTNGNFTQYLTFFLDTEEYAFNIQQVQEIIGYQKVTSIPLVKSYVKGITNLRGKIIPTLDLRVRFHMNETEYTKETCIIVVDIPDQVPPLRIGLIVDRVSEVLSIPMENIHTDKDSTSDLNSEYLQGVAVVNEEVKMLLDLEKIITHEDAHEIEALTKQQA